MKWRSLPFWIGVLLVAVYGFRAVSGAIGGAAYARGSRMADEGDYYGAIHALRWARGGDDPAGLAWLRGQVRQGRWALMILDRDGPTRRSDNALKDAWADYAEAIAMSPASGWYWCDLADVYKDLELQQRGSRPVELDRLDQGTWALVGRAGRVAVGLCRLGLSREPNFHVLHDQLAAIYFELGLDELALQQVALAARTQPIFDLHPFADLRDPPANLLDVFAEASRGALDKTPLLRKTSHRIALGRIEIQRGNYEQAVADFEAALAAPGEPLHRAEAEYHLGYSLMQLERYEEADEHLATAGEHPRIASSALYARSLIAERAGDPQRALELLLRLRRLEPRNLDYVLAYARQARQLERWEACEDALRWARILAPEAVAPQVQLIELYVIRGETYSAFAELEELERQEGDSEDVTRLRKMISMAAGRRSTAAGG